jgi:hypothetical protein
MKKLFLLFAITLTVITTSGIKAQVTIGSNAEPDINAVLDLQSASKGLLLPRVALTATNNPSPTSAHTAGLTVYNTATSPVEVAFEYYVSPGLYYNDGTKWIRMALGSSNWFYMPSVSFNTTVSGTGLTKNLYNLYYTQFHTPMVKSTGAPASVPYIPAATDFYYYITEYDTNVFSNISINANGVMTYDVIGSANDCSYINIVFVLK